MQRMTLLGCIMLVAAGYLAYDGLATTLPSSATVEYWYATLQQDQYLHITGEDPGNWSLLIDDVTFSAEPPANSETSDSVFDSSLLGPDTSSTHNTPIPWGPSMLGSPSGAFSAFMAGSNSSSEDMRNLTVGIELTNRLTLQDEGTTSEPFGPVVIDEQLCSGRADLALREYESEAGFEHYQLFMDTGQVNDEQDFSIAGAGGAGIGVGTGVGLSGWLTLTSSSRHYQTPYVMQGSRVYLRGEDASTGVVHLKGRLLYQSPPVVSTKVEVTQ